MKSATVKSSPKRRWLRYGLRTFFAVMTIACIWLALLVHRVNKQREAVVWVEEMGGYAYYEHEVEEGWVLIEPKEAPGPDWLRGLLGVDYFADINTVDLRDSEVENLSQLQSLRRLEVLRLDGSSISDITPLSSLPNLRALTLDDTRVSDLTPLEDLKKLESLSLANTPVELLSPLTETTSLESLDLSRTQVSDVSPLARLENLKAVDLSDTDVRDVTSLANVESLEVLWLNGTGVNNVSPLTTLPNLKVLGLEDTQISNVTLLKRLHTLTDLHLSLVTDEEFELLSGTLPNCRISRWVEIPQLEDSELPIEEFQLFEE